MTRVITLFIILSVSTMLQAQVHITRNLTYPKVNTFDPRSTPSFWVEEAKEGIPHEMPLPKGIDEQLRRRIDSLREIKLRNKTVNIRRKINIKPTEQILLKPEIENEIDGQFSAGAGTPNDNDIAVANDGTIISARNTRIYVYDDTGKILRSWSMQYFPVQQNKVDDLPPLTRYYDPRVIYDPYTDRFIALYMHGTTDKTSFIVVGFSTPGDPLEPWNVYKIPGKPVDDTIWSDYPIVSQTKEDLYITVNLLANGSSWEEGFREAVIWQINKKDGYNGDSLHTNFFNNLFFEDEPIWSICPVQNGPMPDGADNYFLSVRPYSENNDTVFLHHITNTQRSGDAEYELKVLTSNAKYGFPPSALQPDTSLSHKLRTNDARVLTAIRNGDRIQYMQNSRNFETDEAHIMHGHIYRISSDDPEIKAELYTHPNLEFGYPAMAYASMENGDPSTITTAVYSSLTDTPGMGVFYQNRYGEYSDFVTIKKGRSLISYGGIAPEMQRWGDYEGIQAKFDEPGVFYVIGSYGRSNRMNPYLARVKIVDPKNQGTIEKVSVFPIPAADGFVNIEFDAPTDLALTVRLFGIHGSSVNPYNQELNDVKINVDEGRHVYRLYTANLAPGIYSLQLFNGDTIHHSQKVIIE